MSKSVCVHVCSCLHRDIEQRILWVFFFIIICAITDDHQEILSLFTLFVLDNIA